MEAIRFAADAPVGVSGRQGKFAAFLADANILALSRKRALESLEGKLDFLRNCCTPGDRGWRYR